MSVELSPELEELLQSKVRSGRYDSISDILTDALELLDRRDQISRVRQQQGSRADKEGWLAAENGDFVDGDEVFDRVDSELATAEAKSR